MDKKTKEECINCENCGGTGDTNIGASVCFVCKGSGLKHEHKSDGELYLKCEDCGEYYV